MPRPQVFSSQVRALRRRAHANGASALPHDSGYTLFAPETLAPDVESRVSRIEFDTDWRAQSIKRLIDEPRTNAVMPSAVGCVQNLSHFQIGKPRSE